MAETIASALHAPDAEQIPAEKAGAQEQETSSIALDAALPANQADTTDLVAPGMAAKPIAPTGPAGQPMPEEDELDELIIEDFTIDGICGVY